MRAFIYIYVYARADDDQGSMHVCINHQDPDIMYNGITCKYIVQSIRLFCENRGVDFSTAERYFGKFVCDKSEQNMKTEESSGGYHELLKLFNI